MRQPSFEGALAADELELETIRRRLAEADAGGRFAHHNDVLAWLKALSEGKHDLAPKTFPHSCGLRRGTDPDNLNQLAD